VSDDAPAAGDVAPARAREVPVVSAPRPEASIAVNAALSQLGVPYVWAGASPSQGFDCSGLMYWAWGQAGRRIPRPADYQRDDAIPISYDDLQPGDLVFYGEPVSHVAMYIGGDQIVDAPQTGEYVEIKTMFYSRKPMTYGRVA
jgi:cell wall-associated NlpC family hydrolase